MDEERKMAQMDAWLDQVCTALDVDRMQLAAVSPAILDLVAQVAHGASRPGGPMTAMAVGMAAVRRGGDFATEVQRNIDKVLPLLRVGDQSQ